MYVPLFVAEVICVNLKAGTAGMVHSNMHFCAVKTISRRVIFTTTQQMRLMAYSTFSNIVTRNKFTLK